MGNWLALYHVEIVDLDRFNLKGLCEIQLL
jgi:hypothetical protein